MQIVETFLFTRKASGIFTDDEYRILQTTLKDSPEIGPVIVGTGGARKLRWPTFGSGKSGGARVIYYHAAANGTIYLLDIYLNSDQESLSNAQKNGFKRIIAQLP